MKIILIFTYATIIIMSYKPNRMIQVIKYKCCGKIFAACCEPECYTDKYWLKSLKQYVTRGDNVEMIPSGQGMRFEKCECEKKAKIEEPNLFSALANEPVVVRLVQCFNLRPKLIE